MVPDSVLRCRTSTFQFLTLVVPMEVFQDSALWNRPLTFQFLVKVLIMDVFMFPVIILRLQGSPPGQGSSARRGAHVRGGGGQGSVPGQSSTAPRGAQSGVGRQSRRFTGRIWMLPAAGKYGLNESDSAKAAFDHALDGDIRFFRGSFRPGRLGDILGW